MKNQPKNETGEPVYVTAREGADIVTTQVSGREITETDWEKDCADIVARNTPARSPQFTLSRDRNGNKTVKVKAGNARAFSIQTNGNLPNTHQHGIVPTTETEVRYYVRSCGTKNQRRALGL